MNMILTCYCCSLELEHCHIFEGLISNYYTMNLLLLWLCNMNTYTYFFLYLFLGHLPY